MRAETLAEVGTRIGLTEHLRLGGMEVQPSVLADAVEAVFGAVFLDGGYEAARKAMLNVFAPLLESLDPEGASKDAKTQLQEMLQARKRRLPEYHIVSVQGAPHRQSFEVECVVADLGLKAIGTGSSRQRAEQQAAKELLEKLP